MLKKGRAIVLRKYRSGEKDITTELLFDSGEKNYLHLHGILSSKKRSALLAEIGSLIEINYYENQNYELSLKEGVVVERFDYLKSDYSHQNFLSKLLILTRLAASGEADASLYVLIEAALYYANSLFKLNSTQFQTDSELLLIFFVIRILDLMGFLGDVTHCVSCNQPITGLAAWGNDGIQFLCKDCSNAANQLGFICSELIKKCQKKRFRDLKHELESCSTDTINYLKVGLKRAIEFSLPNPPVIF
ncbi:MAG: DNA repair protein RecO [Leptonema sp. (in: Bacteria)]|nr:DNA repair protein RecO [Leptonema sp. (in: bacteria)]